MIVILITALHYIFSLLPIFYFGTILPRNPHAISYSPTVRLSTLLPRHKAPLPLLRNYYYSSPGPMVRCAYQLDVCILLIRLLHPQHPISRLPIRDAAKKRARRAILHDMTIGAPTDIISRTQVSSIEAYSFLLTTITPATRFTGKSKHTLQGTMTPT